MLSLESTSSRMSNLARQELYFDRFMSMDEMLESIECVTRDEVQMIAQEFFGPDNIALAMLGALGDLQVDREELAC
jgi:predicted Zn-dependent peptidase